MAARPSTDPLPGATLPETRLPDALVAPLIPIVDGWPAGRPMLVAVSGGSDSTGLLLAASELSRPRGIELVAVTVDHRLREGSRAEALAVAALAARLGHRHLIVERTGPAPKSGVMAGARAARLALLTEAAIALNAAGILLGHTADDQAETIAMRQARSDEADAPGLAGMAEATLSQAAIWVLRPFLGTRRETIRSALRERGVGWIDDPSNDNPAFERVRVRQARPAVDCAAFAGRRAERMARGERAAAFLADRLTMPDPFIFHLAVKGDDLTSPEALLALTTVAAIAGGTTHRPPMAWAARLADALASGDTGFLAGAARASFWRGRQGLFILREPRLLPETRLNPFETSRHDRRFVVVNRSDRPVTIRHDPALAYAGGPDLPPILKKRRFAAWPVAEGGRAEITPCLAPFHDLLPLHDLAMARIFARLMGLAPFPDPPAGVSPLAEALLTEG